MRWDDEEKRMGLFFFVFFLLFIGTGDAHNAL